jgi:hypothetical protein
MLSGPCSALLEPEPTSQDPPTSLSSKESPTSWDRSRASNTAARRGIAGKCGTGIWPDRDIAPGWRDIGGPCGSLPTAPGTQPGNPRGKPGFLTTEIKSHERQTRCWRDRPRRALPDAAEPHLPGRDRSQGVITSWRAHADHRSAAVACGSGAACQQRRRAEFGRTKSPAELARRHAG